MAARLIIVAFAVVIGCSTTRRHAAEETGRGGRPVLSYGYALLYEMVRTERFADKMLLVKSASEDVKRIVGRIADHSADAKARLEQLAKDYPAIRIDRDVLPEVQVNMLHSLETEQVKDVLSRSGKDFERTLVVVLVGFVQQERHLARAMVDEETDANRRRFWSDTQRRFDAEYADALALLERRYFR
jgi:hypothetical protein